MSITNILLQHGVYHGNRLVAQWANNVSHLAGRQSRNDFNNFTPSPPLVSGGCNFQDPPPPHPSRQHNNFKQDDKKRSHIAQK